MWGVVMNTFSATMAVLLFVSILTGLLVYLFTKKRNQTQTLAQSQTQALSIQSVHITILSEIQHIKQLSLIERNFHSVVDFSETTKQIFGHGVPGTTRKFKLNYSGTVVCGCDLDKIVMGNSFFNNNHLRITVPSCQILHMYPNIETFEVYGVSAGIFTSDITIDDQNREVAKDIENVKDRLIQDGLLLEGNEDVRKLLNKITEPLGVEAEINFVEFKEENDNSRPLLGTP